MIPADFIATRLRAAVGPDHSLDRLIAKSVGYCIVGNDDYVPNFTGNVQDMLALLPPGWGAYMIYRECDSTYCVALHEFKAPDNRVPASSPFIWNKHGLALALGEAVFTLRSQVDAPAASR